MEHNQLKQQERGTLYFIIEQACCLIQARGRDFKDLKICEQAAQIITKGDPEQMQTYKERTDAVIYAPQADYDTEQYDGKDADIRDAVADLVNLSKEPNAPAEQVTILIELAEMIADFYGIEGAVTTLS